MCSAYIDQFVCLQREPPLWVSQAVVHGLAHDGLVARGVASVDRLQETVGDADGIVAARGVLAVEEHFQLVGVPEHGCCLRAEEGVLEKKENRMIQHLLNLDNITAHEIMTPSVVVTMAEEEMTLREFYQNEEFKNHSRIPVYKGDESDYITGYVLRQTILERLAEDKFDITLGELARPILSFSEDEEVSDIWEKLLEKKEHISIIIDEYGCFRGLVTMEDVIETMLGYEIVDEKDEVVDMQELAKAQWKQMKKQQHK